MEQSGDDVVLEFPNGSKAEQELDLLIFPNEKSCKIALYGLSRLGMRVCKNAATHQTSVLGSPLPPDAGPCKSSTNGAVGVVLCRCDSATAGAPAPSLLPMGCPRCSPLPNGVL
jgi:hypothetical protein